MITSDMAGLTDVLNLSNSCEPTGRSLRRTRSRAKDRILFLVALLLVVGFASVPALAADSYSMAAKEMSAWSEDGSSNGLRRKLGQWQTSSGVTGRN